jgi:type II secretory pathway component PulC
MVRVAAKLVIIFLLVSTGVFLWYGRLEKRWLAGTDEPVKIQTVKSRVDNREDAAAPEPMVAAQDFQVIVTRNIFQASLESVAPVSVEVIEDLAPTSLNLTLLGTVIGNDRDARAIIVDNKEKRQDLYQVGDAVQGAFIASIERGKITLDVNGKKEALLIKEREGGGPGAPNVPRSKPRLVPENTPVVNANRKVPRARPHRRISFRQDPDQPGIGSEVIEDGPLMTDPEMEADQLDGEGPAYPE